MKTITIPDLHGNDAWKSVQIDKYDLIVFVGDYCDHWTRTDSVIKNNLLAIIDLKKRFMDKVVLLLGNHDIAYIYPGNLRFACPGFRVSMAAELQIIFQDNSELFGYAHQVGNHLWTHAGFTQDYYDRDFLPLQRIFMERFPEFSKCNLAEIINLMAKTHYVEGFTQRGWARGGSYARGSFLWADTSEHNGLSRYHQITGHNIVKEIVTLAFDPDTSVTLTDCLDTQTSFYEKEIL